jgi:hypothetical protein
MARRGRIFESQKATGDAVIVAEQKSSGDVSIKLQSRVLTARWSQGGWVWNRPVAVLVKRGEQEKRIPRRRWSRRYPPRVIPETWP